MPALRLLPQLEDALRQIPGVRAASVVTGPDAVPTEVHVLASPGKAAKQVVRDVLSLAMAQYDLDIDHRIVSVVQIGEDEPTLEVVRPIAEDAEAHPTRPAITAIMMRTSAGMIEATVSLTVGEAQFEGLAEGAAGLSHRTRLVAVATLDAVNKLLGQPCEVESSVVLPIGDRDVAVTVLALMVPRTGEQILTGSAAVRGGDEAEAVARSVLAALNRRLSD